MSNTIDKFKLIAEMQKRNALWDFQSEEYKSCLSLAEVWKDLAVSVGSDVDTCQHNWITLCREHRKTLKCIRIREDMLKGSYNYNDENRSKWAYLEAMEFMKGIQTGPIKLRDLSDRFKLIAEVRKRPEIWDNQSKEHRLYVNLHQSWKDLALTVGSDVYECKRKWKNLRGAYQAEVKKLELRIKKDVSKGLYDSNNDYSSKWAFYDHMKFIDGIKKSSAMSLSNSYVNDNNSDGNDSDQLTHIHNISNIKTEPELDLDPEVYIPDDEDNCPQLPYLSNQISPQQPANDKPRTSHQRYTKCSYDQAIFLEVLEKDEDNLIKSSRSAITQTKDEMVHVADSDYNFLVSFMPQIKKINELQNLQFRAKVNDLMMNFMSQSKTNVSVCDSSSQNVDSENNS